VEDISSVAWRRMRLPGSRIRLQIPWRNKASKRLAKEVDLTAEFLI